ncbi:METTL5 family protein [Candidatus Woesearchaeota archaeon]|nr:METTL5 family protein [Candidatus Woesearchaeota archaeon]
MVRSRRDLAVFLSKLKTFSQPNQQLEQYSTDSDIAATLLWQAYLAGNINEKYVIDLGCGTGILGIGALLLGATHVEFIDIDAMVYSTLKENLAIMQDHWEIELTGKWTFTNNNISTCGKTMREDAVVIMNPPFGTQIKHADKLFLTGATTMAPLIYTMHKTSTRNFLQAFSADNKYIITWQTDVKYPLKNTLGHHKKRLERIEVTLFALQRV